MIKQEITTYKLSHEELKDIVRTHFLITEKMNAVDMDDIDFFLASNNDYYNKGFTENPIYVSLSVTIKHPRESETDSHKKIHVK